MPPKSAKRAGQVAAASAKKQKVDPALAHVIQAIELSDLPENSRKLLIAGAPSALRSAIENRHQAQSKVVGMIEETILAVKSKYQADLDEENAKVADVETRRTNLEKSKIDAKEALTKATEKTKAKKQALDESLEAIKIAQQALSEAKRIQMSEDVLLMEVAANKGKLEDAIQNHLSVVQVGDAGELDTHYNSLKQLFELLALEHSMLGALECACKKTKSERGSFDKMVLDQLVVQFSEKVAELEQKVADLSPAGQERAEAVRSAENSLEEETQNSHSVSSELDVAKEEEKEAKALSKTATLAVKEFEPEFIAATARRDEKLATLDTFTLVNLAEFEKMRDRSNTASEGGA